MRIRKTLAVLLCIGFAATGFGATTGSCRSAADWLDPSASEQEKSFTVVTEYDEDSQSYWEGSYVYNFAITLTRGKAYTITVKYAGTTEEVHGKIQFPFYESDPYLQVDQFFGNTLEGDAYDDQFVVLPGYWDSVSGGSVTLYLTYMGDAGGSATISYKEGVDARLLGVRDYPDVLASWASFPTDRTVSLTDDHWGDYYFSMSLDEGKRYLFKTTSGTAAAAASLAFGSPTGAKQPQWEELPTDDYNEGWAMVPAASGTYLIRVSTSAETASLQYGSVATRGPADHPGRLTLSQGETLRFNPGNVNLPGSLWFDQIIDKQLFDFQVEPGVRYCIETQGASEPLLMRLYNEAGDILAENVGVSDGNLNTRIAFEAENSGPYYVGVALDLEDDNVLTNGAPAYVRLSKIPTGKAAEAYADDFDFGDDTFERANALMPVLTTEPMMDVTRIDPVGHPGHTLSVADWADTFMISARAGFTYRLGAKLQGPSNGNHLQAEVFVRDYWGNELPVESSGDVEPDSGENLAFTADANDTYYVRVFACDREWNPGVGLDYPRYALCSAVQSIDANRYGMLTVEAKGPSVDSGATWRIASGSSSDEPYYGYGTSIPVTGELQIEPQDVGGFRTPDVKYVTIQSGMATNVVFVYKDLFDPDDDEKNGAVEIGFSNLDQKLSRTLWHEDEVDWFRFQGYQGVHYVLDFLDRTGDAVMGVYDSDGNMLGRSESGVSVAVPADGTYYLKVDHASEDRKDSTYQIGYRSIDVGTVYFDGGTRYRVSSSDRTVTLNLCRSSGQGSVRVKYGTVAGTAAAGCEYLPVFGIARWDDGQDSSVPIVIDLPGDVRPVNDGEKTFYVKLSLFSEDDLGPNEFIPVFRDSEIAAITIAKEGPVETGTLGFSAYGDERTGLEGSSVTVAPGETVKLWISRADGQNGKVGVVASSIGLSAEKTFVWESGTAVDRCLTFSAPSVAQTTAFSVSLSSVTGEGYLEPSLGRKTVTVIVDPSHVAPVPPYVPGQLRQAAGDFLAVAAEQWGVTNAAFGAAKLELTLAAGGTVSATVTVGEGNTYAFSGTCDQVREDACHCRCVRQVTVDGRTYEDVLDVAVGNGPISALSDGFADNAGSATLLLNLPCEDGLTVQEAHYAFRLLRDNRGMSSYRTFVSPFVGKYAVALLPLDGPAPDEPKGNGYLTFVIADDGRVTGAGLLADGRSVGFETWTSPVALPGEGFDGTSAAYVPVFLADGSSVLGGTLQIGFETGTDSPVVLFSRRYDNAPVVWNDSNLALTAFGDNALRERLAPVGGAFDGSINHGAWLVGCDLFADSTPYGLVDATASEGWTWSVDADNGVVSGKVPVNGSLTDYRGVVIQNRCENDELGLDGVFGAGCFFRDEEGWNASYPLWLCACWTDPDWTEDYGLMSHIRFNGNGNTAGAAPAPLSGPIGTDEYIPACDFSAFRRDGWKFVCWQDADGNSYVAGDSIAIPPADIMLNAVWTMSVDGVAEALGAPELVFSAGARYEEGDQAWFTQTQKVRSGEKALRSGGVPSGRKSQLQTTVKGPGLYSFWWAASSEENYDKCQFFVDGQVLAEISGDRETWERVSGEVPGGNHTLEWVYSKDGSTDKGKDCAWLDDLKFGPSVVIEFNPDASHGGSLPEEELSAKMVVGSAFGALPVPTSETWTFDHWELARTGEPVTEDSLVPAVDSELIARWRAKEWGVAFDISGATSGTVPTALRTNSNEKVILPTAAAWGIARKGYEFSGWTIDGVKNYEGGSEYTVGFSDVTMHAVWSLSTAGYASALDNEKLKYRADGAAGWFEQFDEFVTSVLENASALESGVIGDNESTTVEAELDGSGLLTFWWAVSSESNYDKLTFRIDGREIEVISGEQPWTKFSYEVTESGPHTASWTYSKDSGGSRGWDCGWLDLVSFGPTVTVSFDPNGGALDETSRRYVVGETYKSFPEPTWDLFTFDGWTNAEGKVFSEADVVTEGDKVLFARWKDKEWKISYSREGADGGVPPEAKTYKAGTPLFLPGCNTLYKIGYDFAGWNDGTATYLPGAEYVVRTENVEMTAVWTFNTDDFPNALDTQGQSFVYTAGGDARWWEDDATYHADGSNNRSSLRSGTIEDGRSTWFNAQVNGAGVLTFWYKTSTESGYDTLIIFVDGEKVGTYSGETDWTLFTYRIPNGGKAVHDVRFEYVKDSSSSSGDDCVWIDQLAYGPTVVIRFDANGGSVAEETREYMSGKPYGSFPAVTPPDADHMLDAWVLLSEPSGEDVPVNVETEAPYSTAERTLKAIWKELEYKVTYTDAGATDGNPPQAVFFKKGESVQIADAGTLVKACGYAFAGWTDGVTDYEPGQFYEFGSGDVILNPKWEFSDAGIADALNASNWKFTVSGAAPWYVDEYADRPCVRSGKADSGETSVLSTAFSGGGVLSFDVLALCRPGYGEMFVKVDDEEFGPYVGLEDWGEFVLELGKGAHTVTWTYKCLNADGFDDCVRIADVEWTSDADRNWKVTYASGGAAGDPPPQVEAKASTQIALPGPGGLEMEGHDFVGWWYKDHIWVPNELFTIPASNVTLTAVWSFPVDGLKEGIGCKREDVLFTAGGSDMTKGWFKQTDVYHGTDGMALRSGAIDNSQETWTEAQVKGMGMLSFWYKVSSESRYDGLKVEIDGEVQFFESGEVDWTRFEHEFAVEGYHTVRWTYMKDGSSRSGSDCAWVGGFGFGDVITVKFDPNGGTLDQKSARYISGERYEALPVPEPPTDALQFSHWEDAHGCMVDETDTVPSPIDIGGNELTLTAVWKAREWKVSFDPGDAQGEPPKPQYAVAGEMIFLPDQGEMDKPGYELDGWLEPGGENPMKPLSVYRVGSGDVTLTAVWKMSARGFAEALDCDNLGFSVGGDAPWFVQTEVVKDSPSALQSGAIGDGQTTWVETAFSGEGDFSFWYKVSSESGWDKFHVVIDGVETEYSGDVDWTQTVAHLGLGDHLVRWTYSKDGSGSQGMDCAWLDRVSWNPRIVERDFTIAWAAGAGITAVYYTVEGGVRTLAQNGSVIKVEEGKTLSVEAVADAGNWYKVKSGTGVFTPSDTVTGTFVMAALIDPMTDITAQTTPESLGITNPAFVGATTKRLRDLVTWAEGKGAKNVAAVNAMRFSETGDPIDRAAAAFLLDVVDTDDAVALAKLGFQITSFDGSGVAGVVVSWRFVDGDEYGNGKVEIRSSRDVTGTYDTTVKTGARMFYKAYLVK